MNPTFFGQNFEHKASLISPSSIKWEKCNSFFMIAQPPSKNLNDVPLIRRFLFSRFDSSSTQIANSSLNQNRDTNIRSQASSAASKNGKFLVGLCIFYKFSLRIILENGESHSIFLNFEESNAIPLETGILIKVKSPKTTKNLVYIYQNLLQGLIPINIISFNDPAFASTTSKTDDPKELELVQTNLSNLVPVFSYLQRNEKIIFYDTNTILHSVFSLKKGYSILPSYYRNKRQTDEDFASDRIKKPKKHLALENTNNLLKQGKTYTFASRDDSATFLKNPILPFSYKKQKDNFGVRDQSLQHKKERVLYTQNTLNGKNFENADVISRINPETYYLVFDKIESSEFKNLNQVFKYNNSLSSPKFATAGPSNEVQFIAIFNPICNMLYIYCTKAFKLYTATSCLDIAPIKFTDFSGLSTFLILSPNNSLFVFISKDLKINISSLIKAESKWQQITLISNGRYLVSNSTSSATISPNLSVKSTTVIKLLNPITETYPTQINSYFLYIFFSRIAVLAKPCHDDEKRIFLKCFKNFLKYIRNHDGLADINLSFLNIVHCIYEETRLSRGCTSSDLSFVLNILNLVAVFNKNADLRERCENGTFRQYSISPNDFSSNSTEKLSPCFLTWLKDFISKFDQYGTSCIPKHPQFLSNIENSYNASSTNIKPNSSDITPIFSLSKTVISNFLLRLKTLDLYSRSHISSNLNSDFHFENYDFKGAFSTLEYGMYLPIITTIVFCLYSDHIIDTTAKNVQRNDFNSLTPFHSGPQKVELDWKYWAKSRKQTQNLFGKDLRLLELEKLLQSDSVRNLKISNSYKKYIEANSLINAECIEASYIKSSFTQTLTSPFGRAGYCLSSKPSKSEDIVKHADILLAVKTKTSKVLKTIESHPICQQYNILGVFGNGVVSALAIEESDLENLEPNWILLNKPKDLNPLLKGVVLGDPAHIDILKAYNVSVASFAGVIFGLGLRRELSSPLLRLPFWRMTYFLDMKTEVLSSSFLLGRACCFFGKGNGSLQEVGLLNLHLQIPKDGGVQEEVNIDIPRLVNIGLQSVSALAVGIMFCGTCEEQYINHFISIFSNNLPQFWKEQDFSLYASSQRFKAFIRSCAISLGLICLEKGKDVYIKSNDHEISLFEFFYPIMKRIKDTSENQVKVEPNSISRQLFQLASEPVVPLILSLSYLNSGYRPLEEFYKNRVLNPRFLTETSEMGYLLEVISRWMVSMNKLEWSVRFVLENSMTRDTATALFEPEDLKILYLIEGDKNGTNFPRFKQGVEERSHLKRSFWLNVLGICFTLSLKYAGTRSENVKKTILTLFDTVLEDFRVVRIFLKDKEGLCYETNSLKSLYILVMCVLSLSASVVMSGSGDVEIMARLRLLDDQLSVFISEDDLNSTLASDLNLNYEEFRVFDQYVNTNCFGNSIFVKLGLGILFLGGGKYTLSNDQKSISVLFISLLPVSVSFFDNVNNENLLKYYSIEKYSFPELAFYMSRFLWNLAVKRIDEDHPTVYQTPLCIEKDTTSINEFGLVRFPISNTEKPENFLLNTIADPQGLSKLVHEQLLKYESWIEMLFDKNNTTPGINASSVANADSLVISKEENNLELSYVIALYALKELKKYNFKFEQRNNPNKSDNSEDSDSETFGSGAGAGAKIIIGFNYPFVERLVRICYKVINCKMKYDELKDNGPQKNI
ncbi:hypothetical protein BB560_006769 [Smittium megazygosporum]|uniref:Uncharacterized protein n=1 Tax=Smittium megazygosporum TaxID=133381 RepID=A0A2T9XYW8_9FUNG|nr:hypothetical protein BB560_007090 [Smittium megazygosporum]PVU86300.1 hypothetical protein BB560_006769 [Smittium megazygosporum]